MDSSYSDRKELVTQTGTTKINPSQLLKHTGKRGENRVALTQHLENMFNLLRFDNLLVSLANRYLCFYYLLR